MNKKILLGSAFTLLAVAPVVAPVASAAEAVTTSAKETKVTNQEIQDILDAIKEAADKAQAEADSKETFEKIKKDLVALRVAIVDLEEKDAARGTAADKVEAAKLVLSKAVAKEATANAEKKELEVELNAKQKIADEANKALYGKDGYFAKMQAAIAKITGTTPAKDYKLVQLSKDTLKDIKEDKAVEYKKAKDAIDTAKKALRQAEIELKDEATLTTLKEDVKKAEEKFAKFTEAKKVLEEATPKADILLQGRDERNKAVEEIQAKIDKIDLPTLQAAVETAGTELGQAYAGVITARDNYDTAYNVYEAAVVKAEKTFKDNKVDFDIDKIKKDLTSDLEEEAEVNSKANTWELKDGVWYFYDEKGEASIGWAKDGDHWYFFNEKGEMQTGWLKDGGHSYYLRSNGQMARGWEVVDGKYYMFKAWGPMATNEWMPYGGQWFFLQADGVMATNTTINGWTVDASGAWV